MKVDVIIPAYNSASVLPHTLKALYSQALPSFASVRTIISDDGSTDQTVNIANSIRPPSDWLPTVVLRNEHGGAAIARNHALDSSDSDVVMFLGSDILLQPGSLGQHCEFHRLHDQDSQAALGMITWDPAIKPSPLMEWMTHGGPQNDFDQLLGEVQADPKNFFYGSHVSVKRAAIGQERFSTAFKGYGWEDFEFGSRLASQGLTLCILHHTHALHRHSYSVQDIGRRQRAVGRASHTFEKVSPGRRVIPKRSLAKQIMRRIWLAVGFQVIYAWVVERVVSKYSLPAVFQRYSTMEYWAGVSHRPKKEK